jgi:hypothetical protein
MNLTSNAFALQGPDLADRAVYKRQSRLGNARQSAATVGTQLPHGPDHACFRAEVDPSHVRAKPDVRILAGMISLFTVMLFVGVFGDRLMW